MTFTPEWRSDMGVKLKDFMGGDLAVCEAARVSTTDTEDPGYAHAVATLKDEKLVHYLMRERHGSPFEHSVFKFYIEVPVSVAREWFRHRTASYNEESSRYKEIKPVFYVPNESRSLVQVGKPGRYTFVEGTPEQHVLARESYQRADMACYWEYQRMLKAGIAREVAAQILPRNIYTSFYWTVNARSLMNFLSLRVGGRSESVHPTYPLYEIHLAAAQVETHFKKLMPITHAAFVQYGRVQP